MYRIVEIERGQASGCREVAEFDSAYTALAALRSAVLRGGGVAQLQLLDPRGIVLVDASDVLDE